MKLLVLVVVAAVFTPADSLFFWSPSDIMVFNEKLTINLLQIGSSVQNYLFNKAPRTESSFVQGLPLLQKAIARAGRFPYKLVHKLVVDTMGIGRKIIDSDVAVEILNCFPNNSSAIVNMTADDVDALPIHGSTRAAEQFKTTLKNLLQLKKKQLADTVLLLALENSLLDLLVANAIMKGETAFRTKANFTTFNAIKPVLEKGAALLEKVKARLAGDKKAAETFFRKAKADIQVALVAGGGKIPHAEVDDVLANTLELAVGNGIFTADMAIRVSAMINAGALPQLDKIEALVIGGDAEAATKFKATLRGLVMVQATSGVSYEGLRTALNRAVLNLLADNKIVDYEAAADLKRMFVA